LTNNAGGLLTNNGLLTNTATGTLTNSGTVTNSVMLANAGVINNAGSITVTPSGQLTGTGTFTQTGGATQVDGIFTQGTLNIWGGTFTQSGPNAFSNLVVQSPYAGAPAVETYITGDVSQRNGAAVSINDFDFLVLGTWTNNGGTVTVNGTNAELDVVGVGGYIGVNAVTRLNGGRLDPPSINITGGLFGGVGTVVGDLMLTDATLQVGNPAGELALQGNLSETRGMLDFGIGSGCSDSELMLGPGVSVNLDGVDIVFDYASGVDPHSCAPISLDEFFKLSDGKDFLSEFDFDSVFTNDLFQYETSEGTYGDLSYDASTGDLVPVSTPEPDTLWLWVAGSLGWFAFHARTKRQRRRMVDEQKCGYGPGRTGR